jgi:2'-hydroxyisoflavone reductase
VQVVDSRDLARLVVTLLHDGGTGTYDAVGPAEPVTSPAWVRACAQAAGTSVAVVPVDPGAVEPPLPVVLPDEGLDVLCRRSAARARAAGLTATALEQTAADMLAWDRARGEPAQQVGPTKEQEHQPLS